MSFDTPMPSSPYKCKLLIIVSQILKNFFRVFILFLTACVSMDYTTLKLNPIEALTVTFAKIFVTLCRISISDNFMGFSRFYEGVKIKTRLEDLTMKCLYYAA